MAMCRLLFAISLGHRRLAAEASALPASLVQLPAWGLANIESEVLEGQQANQTEVERWRVEPSLEGLSRPQVRAVMLLVFASLLGTCAWVTYLSMQGSDAFTDVDLTSQMCYQSRGLISWVSLACLEHTIWRSSTLWSMALRFCGWSLFVAVLEFVVAADPSSIDPLQFTEITTVMTVFVSLMLGFFITHSVKRWTSCVEAFLALFEAGPRPEARLPAIRALQMQLHALGVPAAQINTPVRYGILSAWLIERMLRVEQLKDAERDAARDEVFEQLGKMKHTLQHATEVEFEALQGMADPGMQIWVWVASFLGRLAQEGDIPPMASPIYGRLLQLVKSAQDSLKNVKMVSEIQVPYVYMHTLAAVVHVSNILCATSFGLTLGSCLGSLLVHLDPRLTLYGVTPNPGHSASTDLQVLLIQFMKCFCAPLLYQAFLEIGLCVSAPFGIGARPAKIPVDALIQGWVVELEHANVLAASPPGWEPPCFKQKAHAQSTTATSATAATAAATVPHQLLAAPGVRGAGSPTRSPSPSQQRSHSIEAGRSAGSVAEMLDAAPGQSRRQSRLVRSRTDVTPLADED